jgi:hypothetical protein
MALVFGVSRKGAKMCKGAAKMKAQANEMV